jgi:hypothetical protein
MRKRLFVAALIAAGPVVAATPSRVKLWNVTPETLVEVRLAPAGSTVFGANQCANDKDGQVEFDEMLRITDAPPGRYDLRLRDVKGRVCFARGVLVPLEGSFSIGEKELVDCVP